MLARLFTSTTHSRRRRRQLWGAAAGALLLCTCGGDDGDGPAGSGMFVSSAGSAGEDSMPSNMSGSGGGSNTGGSGGMGGSQVNASGSGGMTAAAAGTGGGTGFTNVGVCGNRGESPVTSNSFDGFEEMYIISDEGFGMDICVVRFDVARVGNAPAGCVDCEWSHEVEYSNPQILTDVDGVCANSGLALTTEKIDEIDGSRAAYGFVNEYAGHVSVLLKYDAGRGTWEPNGNANWSEQTGQLRFDRRDGTCEY